jgi:hypothetical protein
MTKLFTIDSNNTITVFAASEAIPDGAQRFGSEKELAKLAAGWPGDRLAAIWNSFAGVVPFDDLKPIKKFTNRLTGVTRVWKAVQRLELPAAPQAATRAPKRAAPKKRAAADQKAPRARDNSKKAQVLEMLQRPAGATLNDIMAETGWQAHTVRGFISGSLAKKMGLTVESFKRQDGERAYRVGA